MGKSAPKKKSAKLSEASDRNGIESPEPARPSSSRATTASVKRTYDEEDDSDQECDEASPQGYNIGNQMSSLLKNFESDMRKNMSAKRKRMETLTTQSASNCKSKVDSIWENQRKDRQTLTSEYVKQMNTLFQQWDADIAKVKENEDKLNSVLQQQTKLVAQIRIVQNQRLKSLKQLQEQYVKSNEEIETNHLQQRSNVFSDLSAEMTRLQAKIMKDSQAQEMAAMKQNFHSMLFK